MSRWWKLNSTALLYAWVIFAFLMSQILARWLGIRFADTTLGTLYQYLDPEILRHDLGRGLFYLHSQPPLFNLLLGGFLKLFPDASREAFALAFGVMGLGLVLGLAWLMEKLGIPKIVNGLLCLVFACSPNFMVYGHWLFYTLPVAFLVVVSAVVLVRYVETGKALLAHCFSWCAAILMLTRAVFHPVWLVAILLAVIPALDRRKRRALFFSAIAPILIVSFWYAKNYVQVGSFSGSSWLGMNLAKRWPLSQKEMAVLRRDGHLPPTWHRRPFRPPNELRHYGYFREGDRVHPALDAPYKSNGEPNFNHRDYARISQEILRGDLYLIRNYPDRYLQRVLTSFLLFLQPGPNSVHFLVDYDFSKVHLLRDTLTGVVFLGGPIHRPIQMLEPPPNLWLIGFPALLVYGCIITLKRSSANPMERKAVLAYMMVTILWVTITTNFIEIGENDRMRWEIEPFLVVLLGCGAASVVAIFRKTWRWHRARSRDMVRR